MTMKALPSSACCWHTHCGSNLSRLAHCSGQPCVPWLIFTWLVIIIFFITWSVLKKESCLLHCNKQTTMDHIKRIWTSTDMLTFWSPNLKETSRNSVTFGFEGGKVVAWEKSRHLVTLPLVSPPNDWLVETNFPHGTTNQKHYPDLGSDASSVWNFCARFSDVIW